MIHPGKLVQTTRAQIGVPRGTIGLVIQSHDRADAHRLPSGTDEKIHMVQLLGTDTPGTHTRRFLGRDLEVTNASR